MKRIHLIALTLAIAAPTANAGISATTAHSRANCFGNNESITWYKGHNFNWRVVSIHWKDPTNPNSGHLINTGWAYTWRQAAVHWGEAFSSRGDNYLVRGFHYYWDNGKERFDTVTEANDCGLESGWWDY